ncbi:MAG: ABC transporter permease, partial [Bacteroidota bacterium]|nr:ABC transporter permease [Bacteroidota bacterium]
RKVLGASTKTIVYLLIQDFIKPVLIAGAIGIPIAWIFMHKWLENFAYRTSLNLWIFVFSFAITLMLTILTTVSLSVKAASINPVKNLRTE